MLFRSVLAAFVLTQLSFQSFSQDLVGSVPGDFSVNNGSVNYSIPVSVAPGRGGMQPDLSLTYSGGGNGVLGVGWNVGGLSAITRCPATIAQDGFRGSIGFDANDRYCLDGQRLIPVNGEHGELETEYRTEIDNYSQIISVGGSDYNPETFLVKTKAGQVMVYGGSTASLTFSQGVIGWSIRSINDSTGNNPILYDYSVEHNSQRLDNITYPGGRVQVVYEPRPDIQTTYYLGNTIVSSERVSRIETFVSKDLSESKTKHYQISYRNDGFGQFSIVDDITVCGTDLSCVNGIGFQWSSLLSNTDTLDNSDGLTTKVGMSGGDGTILDVAIALLVSVSVKNNDIARIQWGDFNGDGLTDIYYINGRGSVERDTIYLSSSDGSYTTMDGIDSFVNQDVHHEHAEINIKRLKFADFNADGKTDIYRVNGWGSNEEDDIYLSYGDGTYERVAGISSWVSNDEDRALTQLSRINFGDFNGDGLTDIYRINGWGSSEIDDLYLAKGDGTYTQVNGISSYVSDSAAKASRDIARLKFLDFNADGLTDIYQVRGYDNTRMDYIHLSNGDGTYQKINGIKSSIGGTVAVANQDISRINFGDFNGDGLTDIYYVNGLDLPSMGGILESATTSINTDPTDTVYLAKGDGTYQRRDGIDSYVSHGTAASVDIARLKFLDYNGDGITDIYYVRGANSTEVDRIYLFQSDGQYTILDGINSRVGSLSNGAEYAFMDLSRFGFGDFNGDGQVDIYHVKGGESASLDHAYNNTPVMDDIYLNQQQRPQLTTIIDSSGNTTAIQYSTLTDEQVYTRGGDGVYPIVDRQFPLTVVAQVSASSGTGGVNQINYHYEGLKVDVLGRGSLGFRQITEDHLSTGKQTITTFDQRSFPYTGNVVSVEERYNGERISYVVNSTAAIEHFPGVYQLNTTLSEEYSYELGSPSTPVSIFTTENSDIDPYGNIGRIDVTTQGNDGTAPFVTTTLSQYTNDETQWYLGRLTQARVIHVDPEGNREERLTRFTYDASTGLLVTESIVGADSGDTLTTVSRTYDAYGEIVRTETTASGSEDVRFSTKIYDDAGRVLETCNAYNECTQQLYDQRGQLITTTGANGVSVSWEYDTLGRQTRELRADGTETTTDRYFANDPANPGACGELAAFAYSCTITQSSGSQPVIVQHDTLGRTVRTIKVGFDGRSIFSDTDYNHSGLVTRVSRDYYAGDQIYWATSEYDALDRVINVSEPGPNYEPIEITTQYDGLTRTVISGPDARTKIITTNAIGQKIRVDEEVGSYIEYTYNSDGDLRSTTVNGDPATIITLTYDEFGRKVAMDDPDMGQWSYDYNGFGELIRQTDAKGQTSTMEYDLLGRMIERNEAEGRSTWLYGTLASGQETIGKLRREWTADTHKVYQYDALGRIDRVVHRIDDEVPVNIQYTYDEYGRAQRTRWSSQESTFHTDNVYNEYGYLSAVQGLRSAAESHDYSALQPLIQEGVSLAGDYLNQADTLRDLGNYYETQIAYYQLMLGNGDISPEMEAQLTQHQLLLSDIVSAGQNLSPDILDHIHNTIDTLDAVTTLINQEAQAFESTAKQLIVLAEQTLAAADHSYQFARTLDNTATAYGDLIAEEGSNTITYWRAVDVDASGRVSAEVYGNGIVNDYAYHQATGQLQSIHSSLLSVDALRHLEYQYDAYQNVTIRHDWVNDIRETFEYDGMDRLTATHVSSDLYNTDAFNQSQIQRYDALGNITYKSDVGDYIYGQNGAGPHAVTQAGDNTYQYDANGNMTSGAGRTIQYSSFNKPIHITKSGGTTSMDGGSAGNALSSFQYGADRARYKKVNHQNDVTFYYGQYEKAVKNNGDTEHKYYIYAGDQLVAEHIASNTQGVQTRYLHKDALGSVDLVTDAYGNVVDRRSFDAWGKLRDLPWQAQASFEDPLYLTQLPFTNKGYTGHEHVQEVDLIHMNGRMYDATLARFIGADPHIQADSLSQSYNRYSYVLNNPMKYTDPSGYFFKKLFSGISNAIGGFMQSFGSTIISVGACTVGGPFVCAGVNAALGFMATGDIGLGLRAGLTSFTTAGLSGAIAGAKLGLFKATLSHGMVGGTMSVIQGGKFGQGFASSFFTKLVSPDIQSATSGYNAVGAITAALVGGTASVLGGGKFANGAQTAMIQYLFNQVSDEQRQKYNEVKDRLPYSELSNSELRLLSNNYSQWNASDSTFVGGPPADVAMALAVREYFTNYQVSESGVVLAANNLTDGRAYTFSIDEYLKNLGVTELTNTGMDVQEYRLENRVGDFGPFPTSYLFSDVCVCW